MWQVVKRLLSLSGDLAVRIRWGFAFGFLDGVFEVAPFAAIIYLFMQIEAGSVTSLTAWACAGIVAAGIGGRVLSKYLVYRFQSAAGYELMARQRIAIGDRLRRVPLGIFNQNSLGEIMAAVTTDVGFLEMYAMHVVDKAVNGFISVVVMGLFMMAFDWRIGTLFALGLLAALGVYRVMQRRMAQVSGRQKQAQAEMVAATLEYVQGLAVIKAFNLVGSQAKRVQEAFARHSETSFEIERTFVPLHGRYELCFKIACAAMLAAAMLLAAGGGMSTVKMLALTIATFVVYAPIELVGSLVAMSRLIEASLDRVEKIRELPLMVDGPRTAPPCFDIAFEDVDFSYDGEEGVIKNLSFRVPERTMTAVVGPSGCGKTTVTRLIARFWDVQGGSVKVGGVDVRDLSCDGLLASISVVFQNPYLFDDTIENNIKFGRPDATPEQVRDAARKACCHEFIEKLPAGYATVAGEGGATLSGGERQRISIARAILKDAPIVLLDEATSSVDPENEAHIQRAVAELVRDKTLVVIAHRLATVRDADQILVLDEGRLAERGTHEQLLENEGIYRRFWQKRTNAQNWKIQGLRSATL